MDVNQFSGSCKVQKPKSCALEGRTVAERRTIAHGATLPLFRASEAPVGERCQRLVRKCENGVMTGDDAFRFSSCSDTQACTFDKKTIKDKGTIDAYKLNVVDSSTGRKCSEPTNMMRLTCTNGQLSAPKDWTSFRFSTCTARPMPGCNVIDKTKPGGYRTIPHGDTREVFTSATAPRGSNCASVKKTAQCLNARMWVDGVATAAFTQFFSNCTDPAPGGPGGIAPGYDGHCETEESPYVEGQDPVYVPKCTDPDCSGKGPCPEGPGTNGSAEDCTDGIDNDGDGLTDCADGDCYDKQECTDDTNSEDCSQDEMDNNGNSQIDEEGEECEKCFVCVYGEDNEGEKGYLKGHCETLWKKARRDRGVDRKYIISADDFPEGLPDLRGCHPDLSVELISHGVPGEEDAFVSAWEDIVDVAPQCTMGDMQLRVNNCSNFAVSGGAIRSGKEVAKRYMKRGYTGTLTVTGNQYLTGYDVRMRLAVRDRLNNLWQPEGAVPVEAILLPLRIYGTVALPFQTVRAKIHQARDPEAASQNSWLQLNICSEGVQCILPPCKKAGEIVKVDLSTNVSAGAVTMVACSHNGKRANQDCKPIGEPMGVVDCELLEPVLCSN